jgi:mannose-6-phosphate isomerase-like protein (cupin superfamily)
MVIKTTSGAIKAYTTKDGSMIKELMHPAVHGNRRLSLAEATVPIGSTTLLHRHATSEELYHIIAGKGRMRLAGDTFEVAEGDTICIPPGQPHQIENTGDAALTILCCCSPPYSHSDTTIL